VTDDGIILVQQNHDPTQARVGTRHVEIPSQLVDLHGANRHDNPYILSRIGKLNLFRNPDLCDKYTRTQIIEEYNNLDNIVFNYFKPNTTKNAKAATKN
jgi:hypothetical protein